MLRRMRTKGAHLSATKCVIPLIVRFRFSLFGALCSSQLQVTIFAENHLFKLVCMVSTGLGTP
jgi:hypothetical protein